MPEIVNHKVPGTDDVRILVLDKSGHGGANHQYGIIWNDISNHGQQCEIRFQEGPIGNVGHNGITNESLLAILIDRLNGFQSGPYKCEENQVALDSCRAALNALHDRTLKRIARGVEGTHEV